MKSHNYNNPTGTDSEGPYWLNPETGEKLRWNGPMVGESKTYQSTIQTAMQELMDKVQSINERYELKEDANWLMNEIIDLIENSFEKEKEQIIKNWNEGYSTGCVVGSNDYTNEDEEKDNGNYYYNQTYNQKK
jgi:hypothetical protein